ncbi:hypothetical protein F4776DRAFT_148582 [Hypoxylon sp. NC0597]|nr:hypothetical protein F4776DRAFT_148582 [Hypoxylon sp. NC0597]
MSSSSRVLWQRQVRFLSSLSAPGTRPYPVPRTSNSTTQYLPFLRSRTPLRPRSHRFQSTKLSSSSPFPSPAESSAEALKTQRADAILTRASRWVPKRLQPYLTRLRSAPFSHVAAFLVLHELTAIVPLFGLAYLFYTMDWVPTSWVLGPWAAWAEEGLRRYMRYFRKKRWFGLGDADGDEGKEGEERLEERLREEVEREKEKESKGKGGRWLAFWRWKDTATDDTPGNDEREAGKSKTAAAWHKVRKAVTVDHTEKGYKIGIQIAAAYAITKMLLIPRIALSLWATPWLARGFVAARRSIWRRS